MSAEIALYLISVISSISSLISALIVAAFLAILIVGLIIYKNFDELDEDGFEKGLDVIKDILCKAVIPCFIISIFFPSEKTLYAIAATHYINKTEIPAKIMTILNNKLDEFIAEQTKKDDK